MKKIYTYFRWKIHILNIILFHKNEWIIYPNKRMYNKEQLHTTIKLQR